MPEEKKVYYVRGAKLLDAIIMGIIATAYMTDGDYLTQDEIITKIHEQSMTVINAELVKSRLAELVRSGEISVVLC